MVDDASAVGLPGTPGETRMGGRGGGFTGGFGSGDQGCGQGRGTHGDKAEDKEWLPVTRLGRLVKDMKIMSLEEIYVFSLPIKESEIIDFFLKEEVLKIMPVQKQTDPCWPVDQRGSWGNKPHTVPGKVTGHCGSWGTGIVSALVLKKLLLRAVLTAATPLPGAALPPWAASPRPPLMPSPTPTAISPLSLEGDTKSPYEEFTTIS
ncbi:hypothetical protein CB1_002092005 [Camelus ferus]|nr:hypothetical protein CB1_002092005 [Camelus ferus]